MKKYQLTINNSLLDSIAEDRFIKISNAPERWEDVSQNLKKQMVPKCIYSIYTDISITDNVMTIGGENITADYFNTIPKEIIGDGAVYVMTIGQISHDDLSVLDATLIDMAETAYIDALRDLLRMELQEDYLLSGSIAPGLEGMDIGEISKFTKLIDFKEIGVSLNDSLVMVPEKSATGLYFFFNEEHPISHNSCETCMARGHGCNFCAVDEN